jgi:hypothetical protein
MNGGFRTFVSQPGLGESISTQSMMTGAEMKDTGEDREKTVVIGHVTKDGVIERD